MRILTLALLVLTLICSGASTQIFTEPFNYPNGTTVGIWKEYLGNWNVVSAAAESEQKRGYQYLVHPQYSLTDCALECLVIYNSTSSQKLQLGGVSLRCNNPGHATLGADLIYVKIQDNNSSGDLETIYLYEHSTTGGLSAVSMGVTPCMKATVRLLAIDNRVEAQVDTTGDGLWDYILTKNVSLPVKAGPVGMPGYGGAQMDDFRLFDAVMLNATTSPKPQPGATLEFVLRGKAGAGYQAATSTGNSGIPLPDGRVIPLAADQLFFVSASGVLPGIFVNYSNFLDINGDSTIKLALPNVPALVGITFYNGFVTYDASGILQISNDHQVTVTP